MDERFSIKGLLAKTRAIAEAAFPVDEDRETVLGEVLAQVATELRHHPEHEGNWRHLAHWRLVDRVREQVRADTVRKLELLYHPVAFEDGGDDEITPRLPPGVVAGAAHQGPAQAGEVQAMFRQVEAIDGARVKAITSANVARIAGEPYDGKREIKARFGDLSDATIARDRRKGMQRLREETLAFRRLLATRPEDSFGEGD